MGEALLMLFVVIGMPIIIVVTYFVLQERKEKNEKRAHVEQAKALKEEKDRQDRVLADGIAEVFRKIGWERWDDSVYEEPMQLKRLKTVLDADYTVIKYAPKSGIAKIKEGQYGPYYLTSETGCGCRGFRETNLPCSHMFALAMSLSKQIPEEITEEIPPYCVDDTLMGLEFCLTGRDQAPVLDYIVAHGGFCGNDPFKKIAALVSCDGVENALTEAARMRNVPVLSFSELKKLFE